MLIDWFTVGAQIVNFLVLVGLLKYFLYEPILKAMDKRGSEAKVGKTSRRIPERMAGTSGESQSDAGGGEK